MGADCHRPEQPKAFWFWVVADNFRLMAENALAVARSLLAAGGHRARRNEAVASGGGPGSWLAAVRAGAAATVSPGGADLLPRNIHTIAIPAFGNNTTRYQADRAAAHRDHAASSSPARATGSFRTPTRPTPSCRERDGLQLESHVFDPATGRASTVQFSVLLDVTLRERATGDGAVLANADGVSRTLRDQRRSAGLLRGKRRGARPAQPRRRANAW